MLSYWEKTHFLEYDYVIVGGGIVGLSTAASLKEKDANASVLLLERGLFPTGASTKNAGFACFGSVSELVDDLQCASPEEVAKLVEKRWQGLQKLRTRLGDKSIDFQSRGGYELIAPHEIQWLVHIEEINQLLHPIFKDAVFALADEKIDSFGFQKSEVRHLIYNQFEGQVDTGKMMKVLWSFVQHAGVQLLTASKVQSVKEETSSVVIQVENPLSKDPVFFRGRQLIFCTNAFTPHLLEELDITPGRGQVLITAPIPNLKFEGVFHFDAGYYYFRNLGQRVLFGGGRNCDPEGEATEEIHTSEKIMSRLEELLQTVILPTTSFEVDHRWAGIMAFGKNKKPIVKAISPRQSVAVRLGGMGVALGSQVGEQAAELLLAQDKGVSAFNYLTNLQ